VCTHPFILFLSPSFPARSSLTRDDRYPHLPSGGDGEDGQHVAVKIQFFNIANSIASDLGYVKMVLIT
jgi:hypothetical protein